MRRLFRFLGHQEYLRFGVRDRIIRMYHNPDKAKAEKFTVDFFGARYPGDFNNFLDWSVYYYGAYEKEELKLMRDILRLMNAPITLDIGANVGQHSLFASIYSKEVIAFEPYPAVARKIQEKIDVNNRRNIILCLVGLGEKDATLSYKKPDSCNMGIGSFLVPNDPIPASSPTTELRVVNGDAYLSSIGAPKVDFIKMDIEGFEVYALRGLRQTLGESRPVIFMEWSSATQKTLGEGSLADLYPENYVFYQFEPHVPVFHFFRKLNYELVSLQENPSEGNILAMPIDFVERFATHRPALEHRHVAL